MREKEKRKKVDVGKGSEKKREREREWRGKTGRRKSWIRVMELLIHQTELKVIENNINTINIYRRRRATGPPCTTSYHRILSLKFYLPNDSINAAGTLRARRGVGVIKCNCVWQASTMIVETSPYPPRLAQHPWQIFMTTPRGYHQVNTGV